MKRLSIKTKLAFFSSMLMAAVAVALSWYFLTSASNLLHNELRKKGLEVVRNLKITCREGVSTKNLFKELDPLIEATMCDHDIAYVAIVDREGKVLAHSRPEEVGRVYPEALVEKAILSKEPVCLKEDKEIVILGAGVEPGEKQTLLEKTGELDTEKIEAIGAILIGVSLKNLHLKMNNILKVSLPITVGLIIIGIILAVLFSTRITHPIISLTEISHAISSGDLERRVEVKTNDEIGELAGSFNQMAGNLKKVLDELEMEKQSLEQKVHTRTQELEKANIELKTHTEELEAVNKELDSFTYSASHDLKEPLRGIQSFSQFILEDYSDKLDETGKDYLKRLSAAANRMKSLIDDLLALSRISRIKNPFTSVDANKLVKGILKRLKPMIEEKNARIEVSDELPYIFCDETKMEQVFYNLILNAIKYNDKKKPVIEIDSFEEEIGEGVESSPLAGGSTSGRGRGVESSPLAGGSTSDRNRGVESPPLAGGSTSDRGRGVESPPLAGGRGVEYPLEKEGKGLSQTVFFVKDNGIGIEEKYFNEIFGIFKRLHRNGDYGGGTGAGLAIVKRVITDHGGNVWVKSTPGEGSTFYFSLPRRQEDGK